MKTDIWMPIYINTYLQDCAHLEYEDHGFYFITLLRLWQNSGWLTKEKLRKIEKISPKKFEKKFKKISEFLEFNGEKFTQKRLKRELDKSIQNVENKRKAANKRWEGDKKSNARASVVHNAERRSRISPTPTPTPTPTNNTNGSAAKKPRARDLIWDCIIEYWGFDPQTKTEKGRIGKLSRDFKLKKATPERIKQAMENYRGAWPDTECSPEALLKHLDRFMPKPQAPRKESATDKLMNTRKIPRRAGK